MSFATCPVPRIPLLVLLCTLLTPTLADLQPTRRIELKPGAFTVLAGSMSEADEGQRWAFADTLLDVLMSTYNDELQTSSITRLKDQKRRAKLQRWQSATRELVESLVDARLRLSEGSVAIVHVDAQQQVLLFIDEQTVAFSAPRPGTERLMEARVIEQYCAFNDCSVLDALNQDATRALKFQDGTWAMHDRRLPTFQIAGLLHCTFADFSDRARKQSACREAAAEAESLVDAITEALHSGYGFDWRDLAEGRTASGPDTLLRVNADGDYLRLGIPRLTQISDADWAELVRWLRRRIDTGSGTLHIEKAERLLHGQ